MPVRMAPISKGIRAQVGQRLKELRDSYRITQEQLAERAGRSYKFIGEIERGKANPSLDVIYDLAKALNIEPYELLVVPGREGGAQSVYRFGLHDVARVREALQYADDLLKRATKARRRAASSSKP